jgi:hypothetical protein
VETEGVTGKNRNNPNLAIQRAQFGIRTVKAEDLLIIDNAFRRLMYSTAER